MFRAGRISDPRTVFARLATWQAARSVHVEQSGSPALASVTTPSISARDIFIAIQQFVMSSMREAAQSPHSNALWISAEMGVTGLILYLAANVYLLLMGWRALKRASETIESVPPRPVFWPCSQHTGYRDSLSQAESIPT